MGMVTCPGCNKIVSDASGKCPNCGYALKSGAGDRSTPSGRFKLISSALITVSAVLLFLELFDIARTYVGGMLLGAGVFAHGLSQAKLVDDEGYIGKRKVIIIYVLGAVFFIAGIVFLYMELK